MPISEDHFDSQIVATFRIKGDFNDSLITYGTTKYLADGKIALYRDKLLCTLDEEKYISKYHKIIKYDNKYWIGYTCDNTLFAMIFSSIPTKNDIDFILDESNREYFKYFLDQLPEKMCGEPFMNKPYSKDDYFDGDTDYYIKNLNDHVHPKTSPFTTYGIAKYEKDRIAIYTYDNKKLGYLPNKNNNEFKTFYSANTPLIITTWKYKDNNLIGLIRPFLKYKENIERMRKRYDYNLTMTEYWNEKHNK